MDNKNKVEVKLSSGPYIVSGNFKLVNVDGKDITPADGKVALCACGKSQNKPFCDGSHAK